MAFARKLAETARTRGDRRIGTAIYPDEWGAYPNSHILTDPVMTSLEIAMPYYSVRMRGTRERLLVHRVG